MSLSGCHSYAATFSGRHSVHIILGTVLLSLFFAVLLYAYSDDSLRTLLSKNKRWAPASIWGYLFLAAGTFLPLVDLILTVTLTRRGTTALAINNHGVEGRIFYRKIVLPWSNIEKVTLRKDTFIVVPKRQGLSALLAKFPSRFGPYNSMNSIYLPLSHLLQKPDEIIRKINEYAPEKVRLEF